MIAEVAFNLPIERTFHYLIPPQARATLQPGMRVAAPFGRRERIGMVVARVARSPVKELKAIRRMIDPEPVIADERWRLATQLSEACYCSLGEALFAMVPAQMRLRPAAVGEPAAAAPPQEPPHPLSAGQQRALAVILEAMASGHPPAILLHGVTGSGKTELYLQAIAAAVQQGRSAICLVPEIALTPQTIDRFRSRFGDRVAVWHSGLTARQRARQWQAMTAGRCPIVVGARSAVFAPVPRLGLVILDEEHETTYKQEDAPRYHAREVARLRARLTGGLVLLGSATPSIESYHEATAGRDRLVELPERIGGRRLPAVELVDMAGQWGGRSRGGPLSSRLQQLLERTVARGEQAMLLLNRRGFARTAQCQGCGFTIRCPHCAVPLIYHAGRRELVCHYCAARQPLAEVCPSCRKGYLKLRGAGTERVESELHRVFPSAAIGRMDRDTTRKHGSHRAIYDAFRQRQIGLLVGTQMIAKGFDIPQVTLVGIVSADTSLNLPDFRAGERTFNLLTQAAGRAGRGEQPGTVIVQTYCPDHYAIRAAKTHDYAAFYREELAMRRRLRLPPFARLIELTLHATSKPRVEEAAEQLAAALGQAAGRRRLTVLGPSPHRIARLRGTYRMCLLLKGRRVEPMVGLLRAILQPGRKFAGLPVTVDVDPL